MLTKKILDEKPDPMFIHHREDSKVDMGSDTVASIFKRTLVHTLRESGADGLPNIVSHENWLVKIFWTIMFTAGLGAASYCIYQ